MFKFKINTVVQLLPGDMQKSVKSGRTSVGTTLSHLSTSKQAC